MAGIQLSQPGGAGTFNSIGAQHPAPIEVDVGQLCQLSFVGGSTTIYRWVLSKPSSSSAVLSSGSSAGPSFIVDIEGGSYSVSLFDIDENEYILDIVTPTTGVGGGSGGGSVSTTVATYDDVRNPAVFAPTVPPATIVVQCRAEVDDGGGGLFAYDAEDATSPDNDGTILVTSSGYRYKRILSGTRISVKWWGATGDGETEDTTALRAALAYANDLRLTLVDGIVIEGSGGIYSGFEVFFPAGKYLTDTIESIGLRLVCDGNASFIAKDDTTVILQLGAFNDYVEGFLFAGGKHAIQFLGASILGVGGFGSTGVNSENTIVRCHFRYQKGPSIFHDTIVEGQDRSLATKIVVRDCAFETPCGFWGAIDELVFEHPSILASFGGPGGDVPDFPVDDDGNALAFFNSGSRISVTDAYANPLGVDPENMPAWFQGTSHILANKFRFGGESAMPMFRCRLPTYEGRSLSFETNERPIIIQRDSAPSGSNGVNWLEVYGDSQFPAVIDVSGHLPSKQNEDPSSFVSFVGTLGVWLHSDVDFYGLSRISTTIRLTGEVARAYRFRQSTDPTDFGGVDVTDQMRQYYDSESSVVANLLYPQDAVPRNNLWHPDFYDQKQSTGSVTASNTGDGNVDTELGYSLTSITGVNANPELNTFQRVLASAAFPDGWGDGFPAGEYTLSFYVKADWPAQFQIGRVIDSSNHEMITRAATAQWSRVWFSFYHDGNGADFVLVLNNIPQFQDFWMGLFQINTGPVPTPYVYPQGSITAVTEPSLPSAPTGGGTIEHRRRSIRYVRAEPTTGVTVQDDLFILVGRTSSDPYGWTTTTGGILGSGAVVTPIGAAGATGATGAPGSVWYDGAGAPSGGTGINGDYYLNTTNGDVYFKSGGSWSVVGNIKGPTGATGATGPAGTPAQQVQALLANKTVGYAGASPDFTIAGALNTVVFLPDDENRVVTVKNTGATDGVRLRLVNASGGAGFDFEVKNDGGTHICNVLAAPTFGPGFVELEFTTSGPFGGTNWVIVNPGNCIG